jgi:hypothetical protein
MDWDEIVKQCHGRITRAAISEAFRLSGRPAVKCADEYRKKAVAA